jgi:imidazolonepropionase
MKPTLLIHGIRRLYTADPKLSGVGMLEHASVLLCGNQVKWIGSTENVPEADTVIDGRGLVGVPGLVDPHTHAVWAGSRADEFARRLAGENYADILEAGGGILSTVEATRHATPHDLECSVVDRLAHMRKRGVTLVEVKSGYGLNPSTELRMLKAANSEHTGPRVVRTFLGGHTIPAEYRTDRDAYVRQIIDEQLPLCAPHADFVDVYCDRGAFTLDEAIAILKAGKAHGLKVRAHAEQVSHTGIAEAAANLGATAIDHLEHIDDAGIAAMAKAGSVAVLLPGAQLYLRDAPPPVAALREAGVPMAIGTDLNPGSSPVHDLWTAATLACVIQGLTMEEAFLGITRNAARALGCPRSGWIGTDSHADISLFAPPPGEPATIESLLQHMGSPHAVAVIQSGQQVH